jgi:hypothetical protein
MLVNQSEMGQFDSRRIRDSRLIRAAEPEAEDALRNIAATPAGFA